MIRLMRIQLSEDGSNQERLEELTRYLRSELLELDGVEVVAQSEVDTPDGSRTVGAVEVGQLIVTMTQSAGSLVAVIASIREWLSRRSDSHRTVRVQIGDDVIELAEARDVDQDRLIQLFVDRHSPGGEKPWTDDVKH